MVQPAAPASCHSCITTPIVNSYPCQLISGIAQKIADFVTGIFTTIANFVKYCLCMSSPAAAPAPVNPAPAASANSVPVAAAAPTTTPPAPTPAPHANTSTSPAPAATTSAPAINPALVESGKQLLLGLGAQAPELLDTEAYSRGGYATVLIHAAMILPLPNLRPLIVFVRDFNVESDYRPMAKLFQLKHSLTHLDASLRLAALQMFVSGPDIDPQTAPPVAAFLREANAIRERFTKDPIFCAAADAAREEIEAEADVF